ncbi:MAG: SIMPL domain-containing protein [Actinomycetota bacterium]|nr:SIMPL domain-containing protein [Actinomycetota bacterium]
MTTTTGTIITVQGEHSAWYPAERATVHVAVHAFGAKREPVFARAVAAADTIRNQIEPMVDKDAGPVTWWSSDRVSVWSERPWNNEGKQLPLVYHATVDITAKFKDFDALSRWVEQAAVIDDVTIASVSWDLTEATKISATTEVRSRAVKDAVAKASVFAQAVGLAKVTAIAIADPGMLGDQSNGGGAQPMMMKSAMRGAGFDAQSAPQLQLKPEEIAISSVVDARFTAS